MTVELTQARIRLLIQDAVGTLQRLPGGKERYLGGLRSHMPNPIRSYWDSFGAEGYERPRIVRVWPDNGQIDRMDEILGWIYWLPELSMRRAVFLRGIPLGWRRIGQMIECSHEKARYLEREGINRILERLVAG